MHYADIKKVDVANGPGVRVSLFVSGCTHRCEECFNPETWDFDYGAPFGEAEIQRILSLLDKDYIRGLSLLGGEPFEPANQSAVLELLERVREELPRRPSGAGPASSSRRWPTAGWAPTAAPCWSSWTCWWTAPSSWQRRTWACGSGGPATSGSSTCPPPWRRERSGWQRNICNKESTGPT